MYLYESKIGKKYQTVVPLQIRESAGIQSKTEYLADLNRRAYGAIEMLAEQLEVSNAYISKIEPKQ